MTSSSDANLPDKHYLYGKYQGQRDWRDRFAKQLAFKSQDLMDDDMQITQTKTGMGWKELVAIAALLTTGMGGAAGLTALLARPATPAPASAPGAPAPSFTDTDTTTEYDLDFVKPIN